MMTKQRFALLAALLAALLLCVPLLFGATAASDAPSEAPVSRGESFSMGEYVLDRDDDYFHFSSDAGVRISGYIGGDLIGFSNEPKISAVIDGLSLIHISSFELDTLVVAEVYVLVNHLVSFREGVWFLPVNALCFEDGKEIFSHRIVIWIPAS